MAFEIGTAYGYLDLMDAMKQFVAGWPQHGGVTPTITGNAEIKYIRAKGPVATTPLETWTVICTTAGVDGVAVFSVTGSVSGAQAAATAGTLYDNGIIRFLITGPLAYAAVLTDQYVFTYATGAMTTSTEAWTIERDVNANMVNNTPQELILNGPGAPAGTDEIFVGVKAYYNIGSDIYNWSLQGFTAYQASEDFYEQPGAIPKAGYNGVLPSTEINCPMTTYVQAPIEIDFWCVANGRRIILASTFEAHFNVMHLGWLLPYYTPNQWNYPLYIGGNVGFESDDVRYSNVNSYNQQFWYSMIDSANFAGKWNNLSAGRLLNPGGSWEGAWLGTGARSLSVPFTTTYYVNYNYRLGGMWPFMKRGAQYLINNIDGSYPTFPLMYFGQDFVGDTPSQCYGVFDGLRFISGFDNQQENTFSDGGSTWLVCRNSNESSFEDYVVLELK